MSRSALRSAIAITLALGAAAVVSVTPALATVGWSVQSIAYPTHFYPADRVECESPQSKCDGYKLLVLNTGDSASSGTITIADTLPSGLSALGGSGPGKRVESETGPHGEHWACSEGSERSAVTCTMSASIVAGGFAPAITIPVAAPSATSGTLTNAVTVKGGGAIMATSAREQTEISAQTPPFEVSQFAFEALSAQGSSSSAAAGHPDALLANIDFASVFLPPGDGVYNHPVTPPEGVKDIAVELPVGFVGDPLALARCPQSDLNDKTEVEAGSLRLEETCAFKKSRAGVLAFGSNGDIKPSELNDAVSPVYNMAPEKNYPAEFAFTYFEVGVNMYASVVRNDSGYRLRVTAPGILTSMGVTSVSLALFGDAAARDGSGGPQTAFLTNPADCSEGPLTARIEADSWEHPERWVSRETIVYPQIEDCNLLQFDPSFEMAPSGTGEEGTTRADEPSSYSVDLKVPQRSLFEDAATPDLKDASVTLPERVSVSPSAADGLQGCAEHGPHGIDIPNDQSRHPDEAGEGEEIGPDGVAHLVAGRCPAASTLGTVEIFTPLLERPLKGHVYLAQPMCGGEGQPACNESSATNGELYGLYLEAEGSGVVVKLPGKVRADPVTGRLAATFTENPQFPFSELRMHFHGGSRAPLANPQACGSYATSFALSSWAGQEASGMAPSFGIDWDGKGGACPGGLPFKPAFSAGSTSAVAGAFSPFVLSFGRKDREQDLGGLSVTLAAGLLGRIAGIPLCGEVQANTGTCSAASQIGTASVLAGPGEHPLFVSGGRVYLTTGYKGGPWGLSIVVPAVAGPFNLGNVVVRASIHVDPQTAQVTVISDPLPQSRDGVPFRLRTVYTAIDREGGFTLNPTNCDREMITATLTGVPVKGGEAGASASVSSPFAVSGCASLPFKPSFSASTQGKTSKANGASLTVSVAQRPGEANVRKVDLALPKVLPSRLTTLQKACTEAQFAANPAGCPPGSFIGTATAVTPLLNVPLTGPAILVSHGGAAFPDVEFILQGEGVEIILDGATQIKNGITYSRFEAIPDAPISSFQTILPEGSHSALTADANLCKRTRTTKVTRRVKLRHHGHLVRRHGHVVHVKRIIIKHKPRPLIMPTTITGQNGAQTTHNTKVAITGCAKAIKAHGGAQSKHHRQHRKRGRRKRA